MAKEARSARGQVVNFDVLAIKQQLAAHPITVGANLRRKFIDEKDGIKPRENFIISGEMSQKKEEFPSALSIAVNSAEQSAKATKTKKSND